MGLYARRWCGYVGILLMSSSAGGEDTAEDALHTPVRSYDRRGR